MNNYMITGKGIYPYSPRKMGSEGTLVNVTMPQATLNGSFMAAATGADSVIINRPPTPLAAGALS
jgi:hypothetical protein